MGVVDRTTELDSGHGHRTGPKALETIASPLPLDTPQWEIFGLIEEPGNPKTTAHNAGHNELIYFAPSSNQYDFFQDDVKFSGLDDSQKNGRKAVENGARSIKILMLEFDV